MSIDKYRTPEGEYLYNGVHYQDEEDLITKGFFGFCGCADPDEFLKHIKRCLRALKDRSDVNSSNSEKEERKESSEKFDLFCQHEFNNRGSEMLTWYLLDKYEFTEHGGSVPGWPTEKGEWLLGELEEMYPE